MLDNTHCTVFSLHWRSSHLCYLSTPLPIFPLKLPNLFCLRLHFWRNSNYEYAFLFFFYFRLKMYIDESHPKVFTKQYPRDSGALRNSGHLPKPQFPYLETEQINHLTLRFYYFKTQHRVSFSLILVLLLQSSAEGSCSLLVKTILFQDSLPILAELLKSLSFFWMQSPVPCSRLSSAQTLGTTPPPPRLTVAASAMEHQDSDSCFVKPLTFFSCPQVCSVLMSSEPATLWAPTDDPTGGLSTCSLI